jgi:hypothetical protein
MIYQQIQILFIHSGIGQMQPSEPTYSAAQRAERSLERSALCCSPTLVTR